MCKSEILRKLFTIMILSLKLENIDAHFYYMQENEKPTKLRIGVFTQIHCHEEE